MQKAFKIIQLNFKKKLQGECETKYPPGYGLGD